MSNIRIKNLFKSFDGVIALVDVNLEFASGEFVVLLGNIGSGKTTLLNIISGLEKNYVGEILFDETVQTEGAEERDIAIMTKEFGLFRNKTVYDNLALGLRLREVSEDEIRSRIENASEILGFKNELDLKPKKISLLMQKQIQLARALTRKPKIFILNEPLSGLNENDRKELLTDILKVYEIAKCNFIYSTFDSEQAKTLNKKTAVLGGGMLRQFDYLENILKEPKDEFVKLFLG